MLISDVHGRVPVPHAFVIANNPTLILNGCYAGSRAGYENGGYPIIHIRIAYFLGYLSGYIQHIAISFSVNVYAFTCYSHSLTSSNRTSSRLKTGPSRHTRFMPFLVFILQPKQAPMPHPILPSRDT